MTACVHKYKKLSLINLAMIWVDDLSSFLCRITKVFVDVIKGMHFTMGILIRIIQALSYISSCCGKIT